MRHWPASIPSPHSGAIHLGPLQLRAYGLMIALGVIAAVDIARRRHTARGGARDDFSEIAVWAVIAGLLGARAYHVLTDLGRFEGRWLDAFKIWQGGLSIWGAVLGGAVVVVVLARRRHLDLGDLVDSIAPALVLAQAIGANASAGLAVGEVDSSAKVNGAGEAVPGETQKTIAVAGLGQIPSGLLSPLGSRLNILCALFVSACRIYQLQGRVC